MKLDGFCECFSQNKCTGCEALATNYISQVKHKCETYQKLKKEMNKHGSNQRRV